ncbi:mechanosensitive ion channel family protein [Chloroflexi bacterium TSY]|nr:mechanosensitive ion channel family protein [Chloroflexi bacterium TSY]
MLENFIELLSGFGIDLTTNLSIEQFRNIPIAVGVLLSAWVLNWIVRSVLASLANALPERLRPRIERWHPVLRLIIQLIAIVLVIMLMTLSPVATLLSALVTIGVIMRDYFSSLIAGVVAMWEMPYRSGDWVSLGGYYGRVQEMGLRSVRLVTPDDTLIVVPHSIIWNGVVANANDGQPEHLCVADFYLHPDHDARAVREKLRDVAITSPYIRLDKDAAVIVFEKPWGTHYRVKAYPVSGSDEFLFISDLTVRGKEALLAMRCRHAVVPTTISDQANPNFKSSTD